MLQAEWIPKTLRPRLRPALHLDHRAGLRARRRARSSAACQGFIIAYVGVPSFIVTLGGLLVWRGFAFQFAQGQTIAPLDAHLPAARRRAQGVARRDAQLGRRRASPSSAIIYSLIASRRRRRKYGFPVRPMWADVALGVLGCRGRPSAPSGSPTATRGPTASPSSTPRRTASRSRAGGLHHPDRDRQPGPHRDRRHASS